MIGKGAQYLTAAGFGRYRITAASLGSAKVIWPEWLTAATKQAIMAAFGVDGPAVIAATNEYLNGIAASDKAKATALASYINEDPMLVCSLGLEPTLTTLSSMPSRRLTTTSSTFYNTGVYYTGEPAVAEVDMQCTQSGYIGTIGVMQYQCPVHNSRRLVKWERIGGTCYIYEDGVLKTQVSYSNYQGNFGLLKLGQNDGWYGSNAGGYVFSAKLYKNGVIQTHVVPFRRNNKVGFLDLLNGNFGLATNGNEFTESYVLQDGSTWTPPTP